MIKLCQSAKQNKFCVNHVLKILLLQDWANLFLRIQFKVVHPMEHTGNEQEKSKFTLDKETTRNIAFLS